MVSVLHVMRHTSRKDPVKLEAFLVQVSYIYILYNNFSKQTSVMVPSCYDLGLTAHCHLFDYMVLTRVQHNFSITQNSVNA